MVRTMATTTDSNMATSLVVTMLVYIREKPLSHLFVAGIVMICASILLVGFPYDAPIIPRLLLDTYILEAYNLLHSLAK